MSLFISITADGAPVAPYLQNDLPPTYDNKSLSRTYTCDIGWRFYDGHLSKSVSINAEYDVVGSKEFKCLGEFLLSL